MAKVKHRLPDIGDRHGRLTVRAEAVWRKGVWLIQCRCDCGKKTDVRHQHWVSGHTRSCGCLHQTTPNLGDHALPKDPQRKGLRTIYQHGMSRTRLYTIWGNMVARCTNPKNNSWVRYGGRGITVCNEWRTFLVFAEWALTHGYQNTLQIDRIDNDGNYEPSNCRWVTHKVNSQNRVMPKGTRRPIIGGKRRCNVCDQWVVIEKFAHDSGDPLGFRKTCRTCQKERDRQRQPPRQKYRSWKEQGLGEKSAGSRKDSVMLSAFGDVMSLTAWSRDRRCVVPYSTLHYRVTHGWNAEAALSEPSR